MTGSVAVWRRQSCQIKECDVKKTVDEIIAAGDAEAAFLLLIADHDTEQGAAPAMDHIGALGELAKSWMGDMHDMEEEEYAVRALVKLSSDEGRRILLSSLMSDGFHEHIGLYADDRAAAHRPIVFAFFLEHCDDPGYVDEMLENNADILSDAEKLALLELKQKLG